MDLKLEIRRKLFHLVSSAIPIGYFILGKTISLTVIVVFFVGAIFLEGLRLFAPKARKWIHWIFDPIMRVAEEKKVSGATYLLIGAGLTIYFFPKPYAIVSLLMLTLSDTAAALIGVAYGKTKLWAKSLEGSLAFFASAAVIVSLTPGIGFKEGLVGVLTGTLTELLPIPLNDNLTIPLITAGAMTLTAVYL